MHHITNKHGRGQGKVHIVARVKHNEKQLFRRAGNFKCLPTSHLYKHCVQQVAIQSAATALNFQIIFVTNMQKRIHTIQSLHQCHASVASL